MARLTKAQKDKARGIKSARITEARAKFGKATPKTDAKKRPTATRKAPGRLETSKPGNIFSKRSRDIDAAVERAKRGKR